eukprot:829589-Pelagomonas_calceolata.AAC.4
MEPSICGIGPGTPHQSKEKVDVQSLRKSRRTSPGAAKVQGGHTTAHMRFFHVFVVAPAFSLGRAPNTENLGLEEAGVQLGPKGQVIVDEYCRSSVPSIWAVGDVIDRIQVGLGWGRGGGEEV